MSSTVIYNATIVTMDEHRTIIPHGHIVIDGRRIVAVGPGHGPHIPHAQSLDAEEAVVLPGFIQPHIHLAQTLFQGVTDNVDLMTWLKRHIWPLEAAHGPQSLYCSSLYGIAQLLRSGTTTIVDMGTVRHTNAVFQGIYESGIRAVAGKCLMDIGEDVPAALMEPWDSGLQESEALFRQWNGQDDNRIRYAFCPRFVISCSDRLLVEVSSVSRTLGAFVHTHAAETQDEVDMVYSRTGLRNIQFLDSMNLLTNKTIVAHGIWLSASELDSIQAAQACLVHCPSSNLKLGSGIAPIAKWKHHGVRFGIGADGAACNDRLDMFTEMRLAALIQRRRPQPWLSAQEIVEQATIKAAMMLGLDSDIGSITPGKKADLVMVAGNPRLWDDLDVSSVYRDIVFRAGAEDVALTMVDGKILFHHGDLMSIDIEDVMSMSREHAQRMAREVDMGSS